MTVQEWKELFSDIGLSKADMDKWHTQFEKRFPNDHQSFLEWLGVDPEKIKSIRLGK